MSESQSSYEYDSDTTDATDASDASNATDASYATDSEGSEESFASIAAALTSFSERMEQLEQTLGDVSAGIAHMETPMSSVALGNFLQPRFLEAAPFRSTVFKLRPAAQKEYGLATETATFAELCAAIRAKNPEALLDVLHHLDRLVE